MRTYLLVKDHKYRSLWDVKRRFFGIWWPTLEVVGGDTAEDAAKRLQQRTIKILVAKPEYIEVGYD